MAKYKLSFRKSVRKDLRKLPKGAVRRLLTRLEELAEDPYSSACSPITWPDCSRMRLGLYRIVFEVRESNIIVSAVQIDSA